MTARWTEPVKTDNRQKAPYVGKWKYYIGGNVMPRKYEKVQEYVPIVKEMVEAGYTHQEIANKLGFGGKTVVRNLLERSKIKEKTIPKQRGRKPAKTLQEYKDENKRLKMENELLRDFLSLTERK